MTTRNSPYNTGKQPVALADRNAHAVSGTASVEIESFPQTLYVRRFGEPDTLLIPLLEAAREAYQLVERFSTQGEERFNAISLCSMHLASSLLRDNQFSLGTRGMSPENLYVVNFETGTLHLTTRLYSAVNRRTSFFRVELAGNIVKGPFVVRDPVQGTIIMQVEEEKLRQPNFFVSILANECIRAQMEQERFGRTPEVAFPEASDDMRFVLDLAGQKVPVTLRRKAQEAGWEIIDGRQQQWIGSLSPDMEAQLAAILSYIRGLFHE